jgi:hypothetical protein
MNIKYACSQIIHLLSGRNAKNNKYGGSTQTHNGLIKCCIVGIITQTMILYLQP